MTPVYGLLLLALPVLILYATWRPSSGKKLRRAEKSRMETESARSATPTTRTDMTPLDYPIPDVVSSNASVLRRSGATYDRKLKRSR